MSFEWLKSGFTVLPIQMYNWVSRPTEDFHRTPPPPGLVLMTFTLSMNAVAILVRYRVRKEAQVVGFDRVPPSRGAFS